MTTEATPRSRNQREKIYDELIAANTAGGGIAPWVHTRTLAKVSGAARVASRIDELRNDYIIDTRIIGTEAAYRIVGPRTEPRRRQSAEHCKTCRCLLEENGQIPLP